MLICFVFVPLCDRSAYLQDYACRGPVGVQELYRLELDTVFHLWSLRLSVLVYCIVRSSQTSTGRLLLKKGSLSKGIVMAATSNRLYISAPNHLPPTYHNLSLTLYTRPKRNLELQKSKRFTSPFSNGS